MADFKPGDTVQLKSGGPVMTVREIDSDRDVVCDWFDKKQQRQQIFAPHMLKAVSSDWEGFLREQAEPQDFD